MSLSASRSVDAVTGSGIRAIANAAWQVPGAIRLEMGEPDFPTPAHIVAAAHEAARSGATRYTPTAGIPELRAALAAKVRAVNGLDADPGDVFVCAGAVQGLAAVYRSLLDEGDEILVPDPGWPNFANLALLAGARPVTYELEAAAGFLPDLAALDRLVTARTRAILVNSPSNPLGVVWPAATLAALARWAAGRGLWVVSDECYDQLGLDDDPPPSVAAVAPDAPVVTVYSFSKTYAMTGWRIGYVVAPAPVAGRVAKVLETAVSCVSAPGQHAALAALRGPQDVVESMRLAYRERRDLALRVAAEHGLRALRPSGAFYLWVDVGVPSHDLALRLLRERQVAVAPGAAFGPAGERSVRVSLAAAPADITEGLVRLAALLST
ncbi:pyridoxal phosphate-dependent aminotransferase [Spongiactinospora sp. 9N601]|uniref:pyridoxal phosphate-dependent aminotransferase n=1 Tax=Spongiactinospora sp. 9N601 TaxID=3375149 RepID=UPI003794094F